MAHGTGRPKSGRNTKLHTTCDAKGRPYALLLTPASTTARSPGPTSPHCHHLPNCSPTRGLIVSTSVPVGHRERLDHTLRGQCAQKQTIAAFDESEVLTVASSRPRALQTLWLGIRGTADDALNGAILAILRALAKDELIAMTNFPRPITTIEGGVVDAEAVRQMITTHSNDLQVHGLPALDTAIMVAASKDGIWSIAATDSFSGTDGSPLGTTQTGGFTWVNTNGIQRIGGRAKQPAGAFSGAAIDTAFSDGQIEADLYPGNGEASLVFRSNTNFNQYFLLQRGGDGTVRLAYTFTQTELLSPLISLPIVAGERWKVRFVGQTILTYRIVASVETLIHQVTDARLGANRRHGFRLNGSGSVDNFRILQRETL